MVRTKFDIFGFFYLSSLKSAKRGHCLDTTNHFDLFSKFTLPSSDIIHRGSDSNYYEIFYLVS